MKLTRRATLGLIPAVMMASSLRGSTASAAGSAYTLLDIGSLVGTSKGQFDSLSGVSPAAISPSGLVVANGIPSDKTFWSVPFTSDSGRVARFGKERAFSFAHGINAEGMIVGEMTALTDIDLARTHPVVWRETGLVELPTLGGDSGIAVGINDQGLIVGASALPGGTNDSRHATLWQDDQPLDLGTLGGEASIANDINTNGVIAGAAVKTAVRTRPAVWQNGAIAELPLPDFWVAGEALAINDDGVLVGGGYREFAESPIRWVGGAYEELPGFEIRATGAARDINNAGVVVGNLYFQKGDFAGNVAVRWDDSGIVNLNDLIPADSGYLLTNAVSINDSGQILATAIMNASQRGVVLRPVAA